MTLSMKDLGIDGGAEGGVKNGGGGSEGGAENGGAGSEGGADRAGTEECCGLGDGCKSTCLLSMLGTFDSSFAWPALPGKPLIEFCT